MGSLLDPILISNIETVIDSEFVDIDRSISDHNATLVHIKIPVKNSTTFMRKVLLYQHADYIKLNNEISEFQWETYQTECSNVDDMSELFTQKYLEMIDRNISSKIVRI